MKERSLILTISLIATLFIGADMNKEIPIKESCGYNYIENNSIIAESNNKCFRYIRPPKENESKKLMIVAHPDDETIYGGGHLLQEKYTVVCITWGVVDYRVKEFEEVMKRTNDDYIMLGFTDRVDVTGPISNWDSEYPKIYEALKNIINSDNWDTIITHNPDGEYGHIHHIMTSEMVAKLTDHNKLYYFGHWYHDGSGEQTIDSNLYNTKINELISIYYNSQSTALNYNYDMLPYENWIKATEW